MKMKVRVGTIHNFCGKDDCCPVAVETGQGLEVKDDLGGSVKMTDQNLKDFQKFLSARFSA